MKVVKKGRLTIIYNNFDQIHEAYSYDTCIACLYNEQLLFNQTKYSVTTSKHQTFVRRDTNLPVVFIHDIRRECTSADLVKYYLEDPDSLYSNKIAKTETKDRFSLIIEE